MNPLVQTLLPLCRRMRRDVFIQKYPNNPPEMRFIKSKEPLAMEDLERHLDQTKAYIIGQYQIEPGASTTHVAVLDLDSHKGEVTWSEMCRVATGIAVKCRSYGLLASPWRSGGGQGIHLWFQWETPQDAYSVRALLREMIADVDGRSFVDGSAGVGKGEIEIFPRQDEVEEGRFGNQVWLPGGRKSCLLLEGGNDGYIEASLQDMAAYQWPVSDAIVVRERPVRQQRENKVSEDQGRNASNNEAFHANSAEISRLREIVFTLKDYSYERWVAVGMALHDHSNGAEWAMNLWDEWSKMDPAGYKGLKEIKAKWKSFRNSGRDGSVTIRTVEAWAREAGWCEDISADFVDLDAKSARERTIYEAYIGDVAHITVNGGVGGSATGSAILAEDAPLPAMRRNQNGEILATLQNAQIWLSTPHACREMIKYDNFRDEIMFAPANDPTGWRPFKDVDFTRVRLAMESRGFKAVSREMAKDVVKMVAEQNCFDTAITWLEGLEWDGVPRIDTFMSQYFSAERGKYSEAVSRYMWSALAGRVLKPGVKADMVPVLIGLQGVGKTAGLIELVPSEDFYESVNLLERDADMSRRMRGKLVMEIGELKGLHSRDMETIKEFITRTHESFRPLYGEFFKKYPRRGIFIGTSNLEEFLADSTGNRRWLPLRCGKVNVEALRHDRLLIWAEARELFKKNGIMWRDAQDLGAKVHDDHRMGDIWRDEIVEWYYGIGKHAAVPFKPSEKEYITTHDVFKYALGLDIRQIKRGDEMRLSSVLRELGFTKDRTRSGNKRLWVWIKTESSNIP